jgi:PKD repeat protein
MEPKIGAAPLAVAFTDESTGDLRSRLWEFGDGSTAQGLNPQHVYPQEGIYEVRLTVTGRCTASDGNQSSSTEIVTVGSLSSIEIVPAGPRCVAFVLTNAVEVQGGEIGISFDPMEVLPTKVKADSGLPPGAIIRFQPNAEVNCTSESNVTAGFTLGWINSLDEKTLTAPGRHRLFRVCFELADGAPLGSCSPLHFVQCLGVPAAPVRNVVTEADGSSVPLFPFDGMGCVLPDIPFRRGDSNLDGQFDISDAVATLGCLFLGSECSTCSDAADANDDGLINVADPVYLLNWRFSGGVEPPAPFDACGVDPTSDALDDCEEFAPCP